MVSEEYAVALKRLLSMTATKNLILANITGYDVSYISKWINGVKLPATKYIEQINEKLAKYFTDAAIASGKRQELCSFLTLPENTPNLEFELLQYLCAAYRYSLRTSNSHRLDNMGTTKVITGNHDTVLFIYNLFKEKLSQNQGECNILILGDFCDLIDIDFWKCLKVEGDSAPHVTVYAGITLQKLTENPKYTKKLYDVLESLLHCDFNLYDSELIKRGNTIIMENEFVIQYSLQGKNGIGICTYISDSALVQDIYNRFYVCFTNQQQAVLAPAKQLGIQDIGFRTAFYSSNRYFFFLTNGFDFLLPIQAIDDFLKKINASKQVIRQIGQLQIMWDELLSTSNVEFMLPMTSIIRYIETGNMLFTDMEYKMKATYRKIHLKHVLEEMRRNPNITIGVLQDSMETTKYRVSNLSYYSNYEVAFFKKNPQYIGKEVKPFYIISSKILVKCFQASFELVKKSPIYRQFTYKDIHQKYEQYKRFVERTIDLYETM